MSIKQYIEINSSFLKNLEKLLFENRIKKSHFTKNIGISPSLLTSYYNGSVKKITSEKALKIADYFNTTIDDLFVENVKPKNIVSEPIIQYGTNEYNNKVDLETYLWFSKIIYENFNDYEFSQIFGKGQTEFLEDVQNNKLNLNVLAYLRQKKQVDLNNLFEKKSISETQKMLFNKK